MAPPPQRVAESESSGALVQMTLAQARALAQRQVITPKTIVRARNEFFCWREAPGPIREALAEGFSCCWQTMQARGAELVARLRLSLNHEPPFRVGTWRFRRRLAPFDVDEVEARLQQPLSAVLPMFTAER
ncbi:MAG: hypothetical protein ACK42L_07520 [Thermoanaerobaculum sp.]